MADERQVTAKRSRRSITPERVASGPLFSPQVDVIERADSIVILADMPGVTVENADVVLESGVLTIDGKATAQHEPDMSLRTREYEVGDFHRHFSVGEGLDPEHVEASMKGGVLRLVLPKAPQYKTRRIEIKDR